MKRRDIIDYVLLPLIVISFSLILGMIFDDILIGATMLAFGFLNSYYMAVGKWSNYIFGLLFSVTYAIACFNNGLYGFAIFTVLIYTPIQIYGLINWSKNTKDDEVLMKSLNVKTGLLLTTILVMFSLMLGYLLSLIPGQNLPFLDSSSQIVNVCSIIMIALRHREAWYIWLINNIIDLTIWIINATNGTINSEMALITSVMYLIMNVIGLVMWIKIERRQKENI